MSQVRSLAGGGLALFATIAGSVAAMFFAKGMADAIVYVGEMAMR